MRMISARRFIGRYVNCPPYLHSRFSVIALSRCEDHRHSAPIRGGPAECERQRRRETSRAHQRRCTWLASPRKTPTRQYRTEATSRADTSCNGPSHPLSAHIRGLFPVLESAPGSRAKPGSKCLCSGSKQGLQTRRTRTKTVLQHPLSPINRSVIGGRIHREVGPTHWPDVAI